MSMNKTKLFKTKKYLFISQEEIMVTLQHHLFRTRCTPVLVADFML